MLLALLCTAVIAVAGPTDPPPADSVSLSMRAIADAERGSYSLDATQETVEALLARAQKLLGVPLRVDWQALHWVSVEKDDRIDFHAKDLPPLVMLQAMAAAMGSEREHPIVDASAGQLVITSQRGLAALRETVIYDIADIISDPTLVDTLAVMATPVSAPATATPTANEKHDDGNTTALESPMRALIDRVAEILQEHIDFDGWTDNGGDRNKLTAEAGRLIISTSPMTHRQIRTLLVGLREEAPNAARVSLVVAAIPTKELDPLMKAAGDDRVALRAAIEKAPGFRPLWSPSTVTRFDHEAKLESAEGNSNALTSITASQDRAKRSMTLGLRLALKSGERTAKFEASLAGDRRHLVEVVRLPAGPDEEMTWVVLVDARSERVN